MAWIRACGGSPAVPDGRTSLPTDDVTLWQQCGGVSNPTYTTLAQILADVGYLSALMSSDNAVNYLVRSTTFASTICANQTAMQYIGANNYASNTLLGDSTWRTAICNSSYFERVLNAKVPNMTSDTTPSGKVTSSSQAGANYRYLAFNGSLNSNGWSSNENDGRTGWIKYQFTQPIKLYKATGYIYRSAGDYNANPHVNIQCSADDSTFNTLGSIQFSRTNTLYSAILPNVNNEGAYIRAYIDSNTSGVVGNGYKFQFYGRKDV